MKAKKAKTVKASVHPDEKVLADDLEKKIGRQHFNHFLPFFFSHDIYLTRLFL